MLMHSVCARGFAILSLLTAAFDLLPAAAAHGEDSVTLHERPFQPGHYDVIEDGQREGTVQERPFQRGEYEVFDRDGRRVREIRQEPFPNGSGSLPPSGQNVTPAE
jgi:hypothetical protein